MVRHSPSLESGRPIQKWEVKAIADAVESWYENGVPPPRKQKTAPQPAQPEQSNQSATPEYTRPIQKEDVKPLVDDAEQLLTGGDEDKLLEEQIRALRIEEAILAYAPELADQLRHDERPHWITAEQYRLLPNDAPDQMQRRNAILVHRNLGHQLQKARESGTPFTKDTVLDYYRQFRRHNLPARSRDFTLENLFAIAQRDVLLGYRMRHESGRLEGLYQDSVTLHNLIEEAAGLWSEQPAQTDRSESPTTTGSGDIPSVEV